MTELFRLRKRAVEELAAIGRSYRRQPSPPRTATRPGYNSPAARGGRSGRFPKGTTPLPKAQSPGIAQAPQPPRAHTLERPACLSGMEPAPKGQEAQRDSLPLPTLPNSQAKGQRGASLSMSTSRRNRTRDRGPRDALT